MLPRGVVAELLLIPDKVSEIAALERGESPQSLDQTSVNEELYELPKPPSEAPLTITIKQIQINAPNRHENENSWRSRLPLFLKASCYSHFR